MMVTCYDIDECEKSPCDKNSTCSCAAEWEHVPILDGDAANPQIGQQHHIQQHKSECYKNIDECVATPDICDGRDYTTCLDNAGSYECQCNDG